MTKLSADLFAPLDNTQLDTELLQGPSLSFWQDAWLRFRRNRAATAALGFLVLLVAFAILAPMLGSYTYYETVLANKNQPPSATHWFGTDDLGRDMWTRIWYGARISLFVGLSAAIIDLLIGVLWAGCAVTCGGWVEELMMRVADVLYGLPYLLVVILLLVVMGAGLIPIIVAMTITGWIPMARIVRGQLLQLRTRDYVLAARALGAGEGRILFRHLLPNALGPIIVTVTLTVPHAIFVEAFLSFLGLGVQAPIASWGTMANDGLAAMKFYPWRLFLPAGFISVTMLAFNLVGDGLRDAFDPRLRR